MSLDLGLLAKQYEVVTRLKEGGMGAVFKVRHRQLDEVRVVKRLRLRHQDDPEIQARFKQEAKLASSLRDHPNIVRVLDFHVDGDRGLLVLEYVDGIDLTQLAHRPSLPLILELARQGLDALGYLHKKHIVHRDIAPDNFMLTTDVDGRPQVKLIDLGIAKVPPTLKTADVKTDRFLGKPHYASPEHFGPSDGVNGQSDVYAFGVLLYELLTGCKPIGQEAETFGQMAQAHQYESPSSFDVTDPRGAVPERLRALVLRALAKIPEARLASAKVFKAEIEGLQTDHPLTDGVLLEARALARQSPSAREPEVHSEASTPSLPARQPPRSPFIVGAPIDRDDDFFGRDAECQLLCAALELGQPAQILSERRMGKTSLLRWIERHALELQDRPVVRIDVQALDGRCSPRHLVHAVARGCGRLDEVASDLEAGRSPIQVLESLLPLVLLVDDADNLAAPEHGFNDGFLEGLRAFGQNHRLIWISASAQDLPSLFMEVGLTSLFLNDSREIWVGQLKDTAARKLAGLAGAEKAAVASRLAAGFAYGLQWIGDTLRSGTETTDSVGDAFAYSAEVVFQNWWTTRSEEERRLLMNAVNGIALSGLDKGVRRRLRKLRQRGLLIQQEGHFVVPGKAWKDFIKDASTP
jgi:serine/threonine protein kinase